MRSSQCRVFVWGTVLILLSSAAFAATDNSSRSSSDSPRFEIGLKGGWSPSRALGSTIYQDSWASFFFESIADRSEIRAKSKNSPAVNGGLSFFLNRRLGLQLLAGYVSSDATADANLNFGWTRPDGTRFEGTHNGAGSGRLIHVPISLNVIFRSGQGRFGLEISGGVTSFWNTFRADASFGYSVTRLTTTYVAPNWELGENIDGLEVGLKIPNTRWQSWGANLGAALNLKLTSFARLEAEVRYFACPRKKLNWDFLLGNYDGLFFNDIRSEPFTDNDIEYLRQNGQTFELRLDPSFLQVTLGIIVLFGR
jgi:hypothetical protein